MAIFYPGRNTNVTKSLRKLNEPKSASTGDLTTTGVKESAHAEQSQHNLIKLNTSATAIKTKTIQSKLNFTRAPKANHDQSRDRQQFNESEDDNFHSTASSQNQSLNTSKEEESIKSSPINSCLKKVTNEMNTITYQEFLNTAIQADQSTDNLDRNSAEMANIVMDISVTPAVQQDIPEEMPESINLTAIWQMFKEIKQDVAALHQKENEHFQKIKEEIKEDCIDQVSRVLAVPFDKEIKHLTTARADIAHQKYKTQVLMDVCENLNTEVNDLTQRIENMELNNAKRMVIFSGLQPPSTKKEDLIEFVEQFIYDQLGERFEVEDAYCIGLNNSVVVEFQSAKERRFLLQIKTRLKEYRNADNTKVFINEYTPLATQEKKRRESDIKQEIANNPETQHLTVEYTRAGLTIQGKEKTLHPQHPRNW